MIFDDVTAVYDRSKWALVIRGLFDIAIGIFILARPLASIAVLALLIAVWALVDGIVNIVHAFHLRHVARHWGVLLLTGAISVLFAIAALYSYPVLSLAYAVLLVALWLIIAGVGGVHVALHERRAGLSWSWNFAFGLLEILGGIVAVVFPGITLAGLLGLLAAAAIVGGVTLLTKAVRAQAEEGEVKRALHFSARS